MMRGEITEISVLELGNIRTWVFAGGGNRCWWQAGALQNLIDHGANLPSELAGTSAGAATAAAFLVGRAETAFDACLRLFASNPKIFNWASIPKFRLKFAHQRIYPEWIDAFFNSGTFAALRRSSSRLTVAVTRLNPWLGMGGSVAAGTLAYLIDKHLWNSIHPRIPRLFGLRQDFILLNDCADIKAAQALLIAAASAPPIMSARPVGAGYATDGGYTDNAPIPPQSDEERATTLVLLTRHYPKLPRIFRWMGRTYWQPSQRIPVSTWDCTAKTTVRKAYDLGLGDSSRMLKTGLIR